MMNITKKTALILACSAILASCEKEENLVPEVANQDIKTEVLASVSTNIPNNAVNVKTLGINADGATDLTTKIQSAISKNSTLFFPKGVYVISKTLRLKAGQQVIGEAGTIFKTNLSKISSPPFYYFVGENSDSVTLDGLEFEGNKNIAQPEVAIYFKGTSNAKITNIKTRYASVLNVSGGSNITVNNVSGYGKRISKWGDFGVMVSWANGFKISNSTFEHYYQGVQWWGGDSNPDADGAVETNRGVKNGLVENVTVNDIIGGGIWGSMGENIHVKGNHVSNCKDVGIDFEGCVNSKAEFNTIKDCVNGGMTTFYYGKGISFSDNTVTQSNAAYPLIRIYGAPNNQNNKDVQFLRNKLISTSGLGFVNQYGPASSILFQENQLSNVTINFSCKNNKDVVIKNNVLNFTVAAKGNTSFIKAGFTRNNGSVTIDQNQIASSVAQQSTVFAIHTFQDDQESPSVNRISYNKIVGLTKWFKTEWAGKNPAVTSETYVQTSDVVKKSNVTRWDSAPTVAKFYVNNVIMAK